ncbi:MAG: MATE family efflux transporter, partial [Clostridia bacterium]|nr:MATE family efflux transporter [Clostridia bacterium]
LAAFIGYSIGTAPVVGFNFGARNHGELKSLLKKSAVIVSVFSLAMLGLAEALAYPLAKLFVGYDPGLMRLTCDGFVIYSFMFLFAGYGIFSSAFFTALNDGLTSAVISFLRTLVFQIGAVMLLPLIWGVNGIWISVVLAELLADVVALIFLVGKREKYQYY